MQLYYHPMSGNSRRVLLVATHLGIPFEGTIVDLTKGEQKGAANLGRNPNGRVPTLEDDGFVLWESRAIMEYLAEQTPGQTLLPTDARGRAELHRWLFWCSGHMSPPNAVIVQENFVKPLMGRPADPAALAAALAQWEELASVLDAHLAGKQWVALDHLTLADFSLAAGFAMAGPAKMPIEKFANLRAWFARVQELPAWQQTAPKFPTAK